METVAQLLQQHANLFTSMYREWILDDQFILVHSLNNFRYPEEPDFFKKLADVYCEDLEKQLQHVDTELQKQEVDYRRIDEILYNLRDASIYFGTRSLVNTCNAFRTCYNADKFEECVKCLKHLKDEYFMLKRRLETFLQLEHQIRAAGQQVPIFQRPHQNMKRMFNPKCHRACGN